MHPACHFVMLWPEPLDEIQSIVTPREAGVPAACERLRGAARAGVGVCCCAAVRSQSRRAEGRAPDTRAVQAPLANEHFVRAVGGVDEANSSLTLQ